MRVKVTHVEPREGETIWIGYGIVDDDGNHIKFAGDWRPMQDILQGLLYDDEDVYVDVEDWQILGREVVEE